jgi:hypothetical protein
MLQPDCGFSPGNKITYFNPSPAGNLSNEDRLDCDRTEGGIEPASARIGAGEEPIEQTPFVRREEFKRLSDKPILRPTMGNENARAIGLGKNVNRGVRWVDRDPY